MAPIGGTLFAGTVCFDIIDKAIHRRHCLINSRQLYIGIVLNQKQGRKNIKVTPWIPVIDHLCFLEFKCLPPHVVTIQIGLYNALLDLLF
ncbi:hypothetical protein D3C81_1252250 [compost metagenome]